MRPFQWLLKAYCRKRGILFLSSPFDCDSADFLRRLGMPIFKIPSGEITNLPYLRRINSFGCGVILSTGMATLAEISAALKVLRDCKVSLLHCTTEYPCPFDAVNLNAMLTMKRRFRLPVGYSEHTRGIEVSVAAVALGAEIIEKHFTLSREMEGPDHKASLEPDELKRLVASIRNVSAALGGGRARRDSETRSPPQPPQTGCARSYVCPLPRFPPWLEKFGGSKKRFASALRIPSMLT